jgi:uncharacterized glyoxalase superfamily protein PhnB
MIAPEHQRNRPATLRLKGIVPAVTASDLTASLFFYRDQVGFHTEEVHEWEGKVVGYTLVAGTQRLLLNRDDGAKGKRVKGLGMRLYLEASQPVDQVAMDIEARGGTLDSGPEDTPWGARALSLTDPDGFKLTILNWK